MEKCRNKTKSCILFCIVMFLALHSYCNVYYATLSNLTLHNNSCASLSICAQTNQNPECCMT